MVSARQKCLALGHEVHISISPVAVNVAQPITINFAETHS